MRIKQKVYDGACEGNGQDRFTIAHEQGHYLTLCVNGLRLQRNFEKRRLRHYERPEWQANAFAAGLLMPVHLVRDMCPEEMVEVCGVTWTAANIQYEQIRRR
jgi:Zn-dependent peptidase ImmA (M78 family)